MLGRQPTNREAAPAQLHVQIAEHTEGFPLFTAMIVWTSALVPLTYVFVAVETATGVQRFVEAYGLLSE